MRDSRAWPQQMFEKTCAAIALLAIAPLLGVAMIWIKWVSPGPVLFRQQRIGMGLAPFWIYKLRTMHPNAEQGGSVTTRGDARIIPGGRWLRKFKIDELPQLLNVLNGTMAWVGPRPTVQEDYDRMTPEQRDRADVLPGLTGLAQIRGGATMLWPARIEFDLEYIERRSWGLDLQLLFQTIPLVLSGRADQNPVAGDEWGTTDFVSQQEAA